MLIACETTPTTATDVSGVVFEKIYYSCDPVINDEDEVISCGSNGFDTIETVKKITEHNAVYDSINLN